MQPIKIMVKTSILLLPVTIVSCLDYCLPLVSPSRLIFYTAAKGTFNHVTPLLDAFMAAHCKIRLESLFSSLHTSVTQDSTCFSAGFCAKLFSIRI